MRWRSAWATACSALLLAACGGEEPKRAEPPLPRALAARLLELGDRPAALQRYAIAAVNRGAVPPALQEELLSRVNAYAIEPTAQRKRELEEWIEERSP